MINIEVVADVDCLLLLLLLWIKIGGLVLSLLSILHELLLWLMLLMELSLTITLIEASCVRTTHRITTHLMLVLELTIIVASSITRELAVWHIHLCHHILLPIELHLLLTVLI